MEFIGNVSELVLSILTGKHSSYLSPIKATHMLNKIYKPEQGFSAQETLNKTRHWVLIISVGKILLIQPRKLTDKQALLLLKTKVLLFSCSE